MTIYVYLSHDSDRTRHWILADVGALKIIGRIIHRIFQLPLKLMGDYVNLQNDTPNALQLLLEAATFQHDKRDGVITTDMLCRVDQRYNFLKVCTDIFVACVILMRDFFQLPLQRSPGDFYITFIQAIEMGAVMWVLLSSGSDQTSVRLCQVLDYSHEECPTQAGFQLMAPCV